MVLPPETLTRLSRQLRQKQTLAEAKLWQTLRGGKLDGHKFRCPQSIGSQYIADFAYEKLRLVIELDSGVHESDERDLADQFRQQAIETLGWSVLRFPNGEVMARLPEVLAAVRRHANLARP